jgi:hypothetical protein
LIIIFFIRPIIDEYFGGDLAINVRQSIKSVKSYLVLLESIAECFLVELNGNVANEDLLSQYDNGGSEESLEEPRKISRKKFEI